VFSNKNRRFLLENTLAPKITPRPIFERSEKEGVNRLVSYFLQIP
jgi:hypothetical protein